MTVVKWLSALAFAVIVLTGCGSGPPPDQDNTRPQQAGTVGSTTPDDGKQRSVPRGFDGPYYGPTTLEERILHSELIVRVRLQTVTPVAAHLSFGYINVGYSIVYSLESFPTRYIPALEFTFEAVEYLRGTGPATLKARAYGWNDVGIWGKPATEQEALEIARTELVPFRDARWDDREAIVFLRAPAKNGEPYRLGELYVDDREDMEEPLVDKLTVDSHHYRAWLPDAAPPPSTGDAARSSQEQRFLLADPAATTTPPIITRSSESGEMVRAAPDPPASSPPTITASELRSMIAQVDAEVATFDGDPATVRNCLSWLREKERRIRAEKATGTLGWTERHEFESGLSPATRLGSAFSHERGAFAGDDGHLFAVVRNGLYAVRPLPSGSYSAYYSPIGEHIYECGMHELSLREREFIVDVTVTSPAGTLAESFFDPYALSTAVVGTSTVGTISWESGRVRAPASDIPELPDLYLDFIGLDGTTTLSLVVNDATRTAETVSWSVPTQPWSAGDQLMLRLRGAGCSGSVAVEDPVNNVALVGDCNALLGARDTLAGTATLNWDVDTAMASWDGVTVGGTPSRVTELDLFNRQLGGTIPSELGALAGLERLALGFNGIDGQDTGRVG